jgi:hypothetical protein
LFYRKEDGGKDRLNDLPKFTQLASGELQYLPADSKPSVPSTVGSSGSGINKF